MDRKDERNRTDRPDATKAEKHVDADGNVVEPTDPEFTQAQQRGASTDVPVAGDTRATDRA